MDSCANKYEPHILKAICELDALIIEKEDSQDFDRNLIAEKLDLASYIEIRNAGEDLRPSVGPFLKGDGLFSELNSWAKELELSDVQLKIFLYWAVQLFEKQYKRDFSLDPPHGLSWSISSGCRWLRTSRGFVCFVSKGVQNILSVLEAALADWKPTPSRLLSAKYRHEISRMGAEVEDKSLKQRHAFSKFYETIKYPGHTGVPELQIPLLRLYNLKNHVSRQSEMLSFLVEDEVADFGNRIYEADERTGFTFHNHYGVNLESSSEREKALSQYNRYICCLPSKVGVDGESKPEQLDSGHIFKLDDAWWVCATPACDLQPGQGSIAFKAGSDVTLRSFTAIRLHSITNLSLVTSWHINSGSYCYVEYEDKILALGVKHPNDDVKKPAIQSVEWRTFVAKSGGVITNGELSLVELQLELDNMSIKSDHKTAEIVAKLRYEYALNYIQRVGVSVSRIGLGYAGK